MVLIMYDTLPEQVLTHIRSSCNFSLLSLSSTDQTWVCDIDMRDTLVTTACQTVFVLYVLSAVLLV